MSTRRDQHSFIQQDQRFCRGTLPKRARHLRNRSGRRRHLRSTSAGDRPTRSNRHRIGRHHTADGNRIHRWRNRHAEQRNAVRRNVHLGRDESGLDCGRWRLAKFPIRHALQQHARKRLAHRLVGLRQPPDVAQRRDLQREIFGLGYVGRHPDDKLNSMNACCSNPENLGVVDQRPGGFTIRRCKVCNLRHFELLAEKGALGVRPAPL